MGRAAKRKNQKPNFKRQQEVQIPRNLEERYRPIVKELWNIPAVAEVFNKVKLLPPIDYSLEPEALELLHALEKLAIGRYRLEPNEKTRQAWADIPTVALEMAVNLHIINWLAAGDIVPEVISRKSLELGIELAYHNLTSGEWRVAHEWNAN